MRGSLKTSYGSCVAYTPVYVQLVRARVSVLFVRVGV